jgi:hypothetical protein
MTATGAMPPPGRVRAKVSKPPRLGHLPWAHWTPDLGRIAAVRGTKTESSTSPAPSDVPPTRGHKAQRVADLPGRCSAENRDQLNELALLLSLREA